VTTVGSYPILWASLALDWNGYPHISFFHTLNEDLLYVYKNAGGWQTPLMVDEDARVGAHNSLALDENGYAHISYTDYTNHRVKYAYQDGSGWHIETVDSGNQVGSYTSLALDSSGYPHIIYRDDNNDDLKYAYRDTSGWHRQTVDSEGDVGTHNSLALDGDGYPHISYYDATNGDLKYVYQDLSGWHIQTVDSVGDVGTYTSLELDGGGYPHISYYDVSNHDLKYAAYVEVAEPVADFTASPTSGFAPLPVTFTNTSTGYYTSNLWDFGDGQTSMVTNPGHTYEAAGTFTVTLTVSGSGGMDTLTRPNYIAVDAEELNIVNLPLLLRNP
jgi:hypothetical protein